MQAYAESFYKSDAWKQCRNNYYKSVGGLCEDCLAHGIYTEGVIVHHIKHITPSNINNPEITLNHNNLRLLCRDCHGKSHGSLRRYKVDAFGRCIVK